MSLESVRALKQECMAAYRVHCPVEEDLPKEARVTRTARMPAGLPSPVALGVWGRRGRYKLAVRVQHAAPGLHSLLEELSRQARGEVHVRVVGRVVKQATWMRRRNRPLRIGSSIGHFRITAGTLGCFVIPARGGDWILSN